MLKQTRSYRLFGGIDVSARTFTLASLRNGESPARARTLDQTPSGFAELKRHFLALEPDPAAILVVMEATGTYWMHLALTLSDAHIAVAVINPAGYPLGVP